MSRDYNTPSVPYLPVLALFIFAICCFLAIYFQKPLGDFFIKSIGLSNETNNEVVKADIKKPLQYGTGLIAKRDLGPGEVIKDGDILAVAKFPNEKLASEAPMHYQQLIGHKARTYIPSGGFFTNMNVEF